MDFRRLEVFAKVAELGSFSRAAEALGLTQPTVSEHVRTLEDELGVPLLDRLGRGATPTRAGQLPLGFARRSRAFYLVTHRDRTRSPLAQAFVELVESETPERAS